MIRLWVFLTILLWAGPVLAAAPAAGTPAAPDTSVQTAAPPRLADLFYGEALYHAFQGEWFDALARLDTELRQHRGLDEPQLDSLFAHVGQARFAVGDFELAYRMHLRAGRAIQAVIAADVPDPVRNRAAFRLARLDFRNGEPARAAEVMAGIKGDVPADQANYRFARSPPHV